MPPTQPKTFMLLPDYMHKPDHRLHLGTLLVRSDDTKLPNPDQPLSSIPPPLFEDDVLTMTEEPWAFKNGRTYAGNVGVNAELPVFAPIGGGFVLRREMNDNFAIQCSKVETIRFAPTKSYLKSALESNQEVREYCQQSWFPSVYMITGLKVAYNAVISNSRERSNEASLDPSVDITATGVPVKVGGSLGAEKGSNHSENDSIEGPFILAYQLRRLKLKRDSKIKKDEPYKDHALFADFAPDPHAEAETEKAFDSNWEMDDVSPENVYDG